MRSIESGQVASCVEVMLAASPVLVGLQLLLAFLQFDIASTLTMPVHPMLEGSRASTDRVPGPANETEKRETS
jgi:hypothetical protein